MKIAFIHPSWPGSEGTGATHSATQVVRGLVERGHDVDVFCTEPFDEDEIKGEGFRFRYLPADGLPHQYQYNLKLNQAIKDRVLEFADYDIVHSYLTITIPGLETVGRETSAATVATLNAYSGVCPKNDLYYRNKHQCTKDSLTRCASCLARTSSDSDENPLRYTASRLANLKLVQEGKRHLEHIDALRSPSGHVRDNYVQHEFPSDKIHVVPHPLNDDFLVDHRSEFAEPFRLLYVGFLKSKKGVDHLVPIAARLREQTDVSFTLSIVGKGPREAHMREQARTLGVEDLIEFRGFVSNDRLPEVYANHDLFLYPSLWEEPLGRVYLESLATGTPIVSSNYGSIEEIMGDGGVAIDGGIDAFARTIAELFEEGELERMSNDAQREAERYGKEIVISGIEDIYTNIL